MGSQGATLRHQCTKIWCFSRLIWISLVSWADILRWPDFCDPWHKWPPNLPKSQNFLKVCFSFSTLTLMPPCDSQENYRWVILRSSDWPPKMSKRLVSQVVKSQLWLDHSITTLKCYILLLFFATCSISKGSILVMPCHEVVMYFLRWFRRLTFRM